MIHYVIYERNLCQVLFHITLTYIHFKKRCSALGSREVSFEIQWVEDDGKQKKVRSTHHCYPSTLKAAYRRSACIIIWTEHDAIKWALPMPAKFASCVWTDVSIRFDNIAAYLSTSTRVVSLEGFVESYLKSYRSTRKGSAVYSSAFAAYMHRCSVPLRGECNQEDTILGLGYPKHRLSRRLPRGRRRRVASSGSGERASNRRARAPADEPPKTKFLFLAPFHATLRSVLDSYLGSNPGMLERRV